LNIALAALGSDHQLIAIYQINLASVYLAQHQARGAEVLLRHALGTRARAPGVVPTRRRTFPEDDWSVGATKSLLGAAIAALGRYDEAEPLLLDAYRDLEGSGTSRGREARVTIERLAALYEVWGRPDRAAGYRMLLPS
jgi:hypothetical protein